MPHEPNVPHDPLVSGAEDRSMRAEALSTPAPASVPSTSLSGTDKVENVGPPFNETDWPAGPDVSFVSVSVAVEV